MHLRQGAWRSQQRRRPKGTKFGASCKFAHAGQGSNNQARPLCPARNTSSVGGARSLTDGSAQVHPERSSPQVLQVRSTAHTFPPLLLARSATPLAERCVRASCGSASTRVMPNPPPTSATSSTASRPTFTLATHTSRSQTRKCIRCVAAWCGSSATDAATSSYHQSAQAFSFSARHTIRYSTTSCQYTAPIPVSNSQHEPHPLLSGQVQCRRLNREIIPNSSLFPRQVASSCSFAIPSAMRPPEAALGSRA